MSPIKRFIFKINALISEIIGFISEISRLISKLTGLISKIIVVISKIMPSEILHHSDIYWLLPINPEFLSPTVTNIIA
jgi:hypothetical protein